MNTKFDELTKSLAQSVTRRGALKKFSLGLAGMALACFGLANKAEADPKSSGCGCQTAADCSGNSYCHNGVCLPKWCDTAANPCCCYTKAGSPLKGGKTAWPECDQFWGYCSNICSF